MYINRQRKQLKNGDESWRFTLCQKINSKAKTLAYVGKIHSSQTGKKDYLKDFWSNVEERLSEYPDKDKLINSIQKFVPPLPTGSKTQPRKNLDLYETRSGLVEVLLDRVAITGETFEPCAANGAIADHFTNCTTNDIDSQYETDFTLNADSQKAWKTFGDYDWVVTNPPFEKASKIIPLAWEHCRVGMAFLLRISYLEPTYRNKNESRGYWLEAHQQHLRHLIPVSPRPRFNPDSQKTDSNTVLWLVWRKDFNWHDLGMQPPISFAMDWEK